MDVGPVSEDCLFLNVWTPAQRSTRLPVFVWIHGGGFGGGSGSVPIYNGAHFAARGAVVVTINYRVGAFGFLAHPELSKEDAHRVSGNYGLLDMIAALAWVHDHIADFGGDPARVSIAGQSAGAIAVNEHLLSPLAQGLFSAAIAESGSGMGLRASPLAEAEAFGVEFATAAAAKSLKSLRALPAELVLTLSDAGPPTPGAKPKPRNLRFAPVLDNYVLTADPESPAARPLSQVPLMTGFNADEGYIFGAEGVTPAEFEVQIRDRYGAAAPQFLNVYPHATTVEATSSAKLIARDRYMASLVFWLQGRAHKAHAGIYPYLFEHPFPGPDRDRYGSFHTAEVPYVFGVLDQGGRPFTNDDRSISAQLAAYWMNFIRGGNPNGTGLTRWAPATPDQVEVMGLGDQVGMRPAVSTPERLATFRMYVAGGGRLSLF